MAAAINLPHANRKFYHFPKNGEHKSSFNPTRKACSLIGYIEENLIGRNKVFSGPYGLRRALYCDYTASGQALEFIEDYIRDQVLTDYGNTHTTTSVTSLQTTLFRHEARDIIRNAVNASEHDAVIFTGSGCTGAVHKLIHAMNIQDAPVVFVSPYEHHSNLLPWKELDATVVRISQTPDGIVSLSNLEEELKKWKNSNRQLIGCFSAASNITGILSDVDAITVILHQFGALAFWDYATAGPYVNINVNPVMTGEGNASKDAIFISTHKFVGGVQTPGVLVAKKVLFTNPVPSTCGGGSVFYVRRDAHRYLQEVEMREEGGTPAIVESVRAGLVFQLKEALTPTAIMTREHQLCRRALQAWSDIPNLVMLGSTSVPRLPIFSFLIRNEKSGLFLHHNFVCALLNDLFGIQARGGCACAGPYAHDLLGINEELAEKIESILVEDSRLDRVHLRRYREYSEKEILRPGFVRLNIPFFMTDENIDFVLNAVKLVCEHGWKLLPKYIFNPETGEWRHRNHQVFKDRKWLGSIGYTEGRMTYPEPQAPDKGPLPSNIQDCLDKAADLLTQAEKSRVQLADQRLLFDELAESIRWFLLPSEAQSLLNPKTDRLTFKQPPFSPPVCAKFIQLSVENNCQSPPIEGATHNDVHAVKVAGNSFEDASQCKNEDLQNMLENVSDDGFIDSVIPDGQVESGNVDTRLKNCDGASGEECQPAHSVVGDIPCDEDVDRTNNESISKRCHVVTCEGSGTCRLSDTQGGIGVDAKIEVLPANQEVSKEDTHTRLNVGQQQVSDGGASQVSDGGASHFVTTFESVAKTEKAKSDINIGRNANTDTTQSQSIFCELTDGSVSSFGKESNDSVSKSQSTDTNTSRQKTKSGTNTEQSQSNSAQNNATSDNSCARKPKRAASKWFPPPKKIFKPTVEALEEYGMVRDGDRVLVCLSGGKDSLSLLHCMRQYQFYCRKKGIVFELGAVTVDPQTSSYDPSPLKQYTASLGVPYFYEEQCILDTATNLPDGCTSICSFCSRMKRGRIYACARREGYNVLAMGQHLDDLAESFMMSMFHNGALRTMKANYTVEEGDLRVIRPFVYVREKDLRDFASQNRLPVIAENCPACFEAPKERHRTKQLLAAQEVLFPNLYSSMMSAMRPLMSLDRTGVNIAQVLSGTQGHTQYNEVDL